MKTGWTKRNAVFVRLLSALVWLVAFRELAPGSVSISNLVSEDVNIDFQLGSKTQATPWYLTRA